MIFLIKALAYTMRSKEKLWHQEKKQPTDNIFLFKEEVMCWLKEITFLGALCQMNRKQ
jgi:hypothetical protein